MASRHGPLPSANSSLSIWPAVASLTAAVLYAPSRRIIRLAWSHPGTVSVAATHMAAYISFGVVASRAIPAKDENTTGGSTAETATSFPGRFPMGGSGRRHLAARLPPIAASSVDHLVLGGFVVEGPVPVATADRDLAWLGSFRHRDMEPQHALLIGGFDAFGVEIVTENQLAAEDSARPLGCEHLAIRIDGRTFGPNSHGVALDVEVQPVLFDAR